MRSDIQADCVEERYIIQHFNSTMNVWLDGTGFAHSRAVWSSKDDARDEIARVRRCYVNGVANGRITSAESVFRIMKQVSTFTVV